MVADERLQAITDPQTGQIQPPACSPGENEGIAMGIGALREEFQLALVLFEEAHSRGIVQAKSRCDVAKTRLDMLRAS